MPPRSTFIVVGALLTLAALFLLRPFGPSLPSIQTTRFCGVFKCDQTLRSWIEDEERRYGEAVEGREELIKKWGPTENDIQS
jgi:hypothetical protein